MIDDFLASELVHIPFVMVNGDLIHFRAKLFLQIVGYLPHIVYGMVREEVNDCRKERLRILMEFPSHPLRVSLRLFPDVLLPHRHSFCGRAVELDAAFGENGVLRLPAPVVVGELPSVRRLDVDARLPVSNSYFFSFFSILAVLFSPFDCGDMRNRVRKRRV
ncbi:MAG: hypothetical protein GXO19_05305 [Epsilonproteobacteria bacterium]|nr:hypothetical protein [Campylobacterota bacterium]